ncbi:S1C family serine protease [Thiorhodococcus minor]|uniref:Serine protease n=1 Tax=Thiorhodococcus minor TaxID=57489 RepID=A0A6M0K5T3_9GAMM|nr:S1C family serine protease [Thiorhodococcus minor]NEV65136.1 serine protease [Thiorhodococcus minor]
MDWSLLVKQIAPFVVRIETRSGYGTGFIYWQCQDKCCVATAKHVVAHADEPGWEQPIHIHHPNGKSVICYPDFREGYYSTNEVGDSAAIIISKDGLELPPRCLPLWDWSDMIPIGTPLGWLGHPSIIPIDFRHPSFFSGTLSNAFNGEVSTFSIDGVAIRGVSGGPVFFCGKDGCPAVIGTVSAYYSDRIPTQDGIETAPGIAFAHSFLAFKAIEDRLHALEKEHDLESS